MSAQDEQDIAGVMAASMAAENRRRILGSQSPGLGSLVPLDQPPSGPSAGKFGVGGDITGEGYGVQPPADGRPRPVYAPAELGGSGYPGGIAQMVQRMPGLARGQRATAEGNVVAISPDLDPAPRRSLLARLLGRRL